MLWKKTELSCFHFWELSKSLIIPLHSILILSRKLMRQEIIRNHLASENTKHFPEIFSCSLYCFLNSYLFVFFSIKHTNMRKRGFRRKKTKKYFKNNSWKLPECDARHNYTYPRSSKTPSKINSKKSTLSTLLLNRWKPKTQRKFWKQQKRSNFSCTKDPP